MPRKRKHKRTAKRPPARQRAARRRALDKRAQDRSGDTGNNAQAGNSAGRGNDDDSLERLLPMCASIGMTLAVRAMCALELNWDAVEDADPDETFDDVCDQLGDDGVLIREVLNAALCHQDRGDPGGPEEDVAGDVLDLLTELHEAVHGGITETLRT